MQCALMGAAVIYFFTGAVIAIADTFCDLRGPEWFYHLYLWYLEIILVIARKILGVKK